MLGSNCSPCCAGEPCSIPALEDAISGVPVSWETSGLSAGVWPNDGFSWQQKGIHYPTLQARPGDGFSPYSSVDQQNPVCIDGLLEVHTGAYSDKSGSSVLTPGETFLPGLLYRSYVPPNQGKQGSNVFFAGNISDKIEVRFNCGSAESQVEPGNFLWAAATAEIVAAEGTINFSNTGVQYEQYYFVQENFGFVTAAGDPASAPPGVTWHYSNNSATGVPYFVKWTGERPATVGMWLNRDYSKIVQVPLSSYMLAGDRHIYHRVVNYGGPPIPGKIIARFDTSAAIVGEYVDGQYHIFPGSQLGTNLHDRRPDGSIAWIWGGLPNGSVRFEEYGLANDFDYLAVQSDPELASRYPRVRSGRVFDFRGVRTSNVMLLGTNANNTPCPGSDPTPGAGYDYLNLHAGEYLFGSRFSGPQFQIVLSPS